MGEDGRSSGEEPHERTPLAQTSLARTPLYEAHVAAGARIVPFAGYQMPLQYEGIVTEHLATRASAGLFDVSHMGQLRLTGDAAAFLERLTPSDIRGLRDRRARYSVLTNEAGGVVDDVIITRLGDDFAMVVNGARREAVAAHLSQHADTAVEVIERDRALLALQGPQAEAVLSEATGLPLADLAYMEALEGEARGASVLVTRCGYTGEDGFEVSIANEAARDLWDALIADERVRPVGLGARDTLRLEAGLCLYGQDLSEEISPVEAGLAFVIGKSRTSEGGFLGAERILRERDEGPARTRVGLTVEGRVPVRAGAPLRAREEDVGIVTSGGVSPSTGGNIAIGLVRTEQATPGGELEATVRGRAVPVRVAPLPFVPARTKRRATR